MPIGGNGMHERPERPVSDRDIAAITAAVTKQKTEQPAKEPEKAPVVEAKNEPILDPEAPRDELEKRLLELRDPPPAKEYTPPPPTDRQRKRIELEQAAGRRRVAHFDELNAARVHVKPDAKREGYTTPVMRAGGYQHETKAKGK